MKCYFKNVLHGFIPDDYAVDILSTVPQESNFIIADIDSDDMPEIVVALTSEGKNYWAILDRKNHIWNITHVSEQNIGDGVQWGQLSPIEVTPDWLEPDREGVSIDQLISQDFITGLGFVNNEEYGISITKPYQCNCGDGSRRQPIIRDIITRKGNITGDTTKEDVTLRGTQPHQEIDYFFKNLSLLVKNYETNRNMQILLPIDEGFYPTLNLIKFSNKKYKDIVVTLENDASGDVISTWIYSLSTGRTILLFNSVTFNADFTGSVSYRDGYKVAIRMSTGLDFTIDISNSSPDILNALYNKHGKLYSPRQGALSTLHEIRFITNETTTGYNLIAIQQVTGLDPLDVVGYIASSFVYNERTNSLMINSQVAYVDGIQKL
ncbi:MAG: hypothetical protein ATN34_03600 [Epulopiscium sp. Nele67-Bin002]|nr:MAG: hypothetical protein ATN34_03600 [Epulopiscium sp. Nele67-Bin002]OON93622.1 MAG: hypothetical protein ATN33_05545 [Epulopiscium sp. Nele67-Bin001]